MAKWKIIKALTVTKDRVAKPDTTKHLYSKVAGKVAESSALWEWDPSSGNRLPPTAG